MTVHDYLDIFDMRIGTAKASVVQEIMRSGEIVGPVLAYKLTGRPDQYMSIREALIAAGCKTSQQN